MTTTKKEPLELNTSKQRPKELQKGPLKELKDIMNMTKVRMPLGEMSHLGDISSLMPKSTTAFAAKHQNFIPEGPHKPVMSKAMQATKDHKMPQKSENKAPSQTITSPQPAPAPATANPQKREATLASATAPNTTAPQQQKKNLSIRIPESSPKAQQIKLFQFKSLSTKHGNTNTTTTEQQCAALPLQPACNIVIPNYEPAKCSLKRNGVVRAYAATTNQGLVR